MAKFLSVALHTMLNHSQRATPSRNTQRLALLARQSEDNGGKVVPDQRR